jgi:hypothetical protein
MEKRGFNFEEDIARNTFLHYFATFWLTKKKLRHLSVIAWPVQSPDLNFIEFLWDELEKTIRKKNPTPKSHLWLV